MATTAQWKTSLQVARFKEHGLWAIEEDSYYTEGMFLHYENTVQTFVRLLDEKSGQVLAQRYFAYW
jgi:hypothetical protein